MKEEEEGGEQGCGGGDAFTHRWLKTRETMLLTRVEWRKRRNTKEDEVEIRVV